MLRPLLRNALYAATLLSLAGCDAAPDLTAAGEDASFRAENLAALEQAESGQQPAMQPRIVRDATASLEVADVEEALDSARAMGMRAGGTVAQVETSTSGHRQSAMLTLRIPADSLDSLLARLAELGDVQSTLVSSADVSREYFDVETRLAVKEETVRRLTELVQRSASVEDLVAVERELSRITADLESLKGQIRYFDLQIAQSDLRIHLRESGGSAAGAVQYVTRALGASLEVFARSIAAVVYVVVYLIPWVLLIAVVWTLGKRLVRAWRRGRGAHVGA